MKTRRITGVEQKQFIAQLKDALVEKDVEAAYKNIFQKYYGTTFPSPYGSDGHIEPAQTSLLDEGLRLLLEVKFQLELTRPQDRSKIVAQSIYYLKKFQQDARSLPNVIVGGDENEMFTVYAPKLYRYLDEPYDWSIAPSSVWRENQMLYKALLDDPNLNVFVFDVRSSAFDVNEVFKSIDTLSQQNGEFKKLRVTEANIRKVFDEFVRVVFGGDNWLTGVKKIGAQETVSIFIQSILGNPEIYIVPTKRNVLHVVGGHEITINAGNYDAFFSRYDRKYATDEIDAITAVADQLIEEVKRRFHGDFWTPTIWADRANQMITDGLGEGWREKYVVWDPAAGTKNLTRDYRFGKLYSSTIHQSEIDMSRQYNHEATTFQYDFLNDDIDISPDSDTRDLKMPESLFLALRNNEPIIFFTNPPYGQGTTGAADNHKAGVANTKIGEVMRNNELKKASAELYAQFIYRVQKLTHDFNLTNVSFFFFNKAFLTSSAFDKFTDEMLDQFHFNDGFMINAGEFQGTSTAWGIIFSNFQIKVDSSSPQTTFEFSVEKSNINGLEKITEHTLRRVDKGTSIKDWFSAVKLPAKEYAEGKYPRLNGGFNISSSKTTTGILRQGSLGFMQFNGPNVQRADKYLNLNSAMIALGNQGRSVTPENFERACVAFASCKSILPNASWINDKDIFRRPSDAFQNSPDWGEFVHDCVVFSLFHRSSYQTSLRNFEYDGEIYDVFNEWFFMARNDITALASKYDLNDIVYDARSSDERFVYKYLRALQLSGEALVVLDLGKRLVTDTFAKRFLADQEHPEWHLMGWDAGYYQAYKITTMFKDEFAYLRQQFSAAFMALETKICKQVYSDHILQK